MMEMGETRRGVRGFSEEVRQKEERDKTASRVLPRLYELAEEQGVTRFTLSKGFPVDSVPMPHKDIIIRADKHNKMYIVSLYHNGPRRSLQIVDFMVKKGVERAMFFEGYFLQDSVKNRKVGPMRIYDPGQTQLSTKEQLHFLNEAAKAQVDAEATQELSK